MKKPFIFIALFFLIASMLVACSIGSSAGESDNSGIDPQNNPLAFLEAAGEKLRSAKSFEATVKKWDGAKRGQQYSSDAEIQYVSIQYVANLNGAPASYQEWTLGRKTEWFYYSGNSGFSGRLSDGEHIYTNKHICDEDFAPVQHFSLLEFTLDLRSTTMFDTVSQFKHSVTIQEDGSTTIAFEGLSGEDVLSVINVSPPFYVGWRDEYSLLSMSTPTMENISYTISFSVDVQGYLCDIRIIRTDTVSSGSNITQICAVSFTQVNQKMPFEETGYTDQFKLAPDQVCPDYFHHFGDYHTAEYFYMEESGKYGIWLYYIGTARFIHRPVASQEELQDQDIIHHYYKVLTSIDGISVSERLNFVGGMDIDKLIIPKGLYMLDDGYSSGVEMLFFEETREAYYNSDFMKQWIIKYNDYDLNTDCYFAGEWEYVDGIPTPKQSANADSDTGNKDLRYLLYGNWYQVSYNGGNSLSEGLYAFREDGTCSSGGNDWQECAADSWTVDIKAYDKYWELCGGGGEDYTYTYDGTTLTLIYQSGTGPIGENKTLSVSVDGDTLYVHYEGGTSAYTRGEPDWESTNSTK